MKLKYRLGVLLVTTIAIAHCYIMVTAVNRGKDNGQLINLLGRQRMHSFATGLQLHRLALNKSNIQEVEQKLNEWKTEFNIVLKDSEEIKKSFVEDKKHLLNATAFTTLNNKILFITNELESIKKGKTVDVDTIYNNQTEFRNIINLMVTDYAIHSDKKLENLKYLEILLSIVTILGVIIVVVFVFYPQAGKLEKSLNLIAYKVKEQEQFNYIVSHDLKEPLRTISNYVNIINEDYSNELSDGVKKHLTTINEGTERMSNLISSILDLSRLGKNRELTTIDCNALVKDVIADLTGLIEQTNAKIIVNELPTIVGFKTELRQLFQNLISNAIKFRRDVVLPEIKIGFVEKSKVYEFYVADNGIGIDKKHFGRIFNMFQRLNSSHKYEGYGVGLTTCKKIIELHEGTLWVESTLGTGSTFFLTINKTIQ